MKKYVKPELFFERYEPNQHIAACAWDLNNLTDEGCGFIPDPNESETAHFSPGTILLHDTNVCTYFGPYCYMNAEGGSNTFNS